MELAATDIDRIDPCRPPAERDLGEAPVEAPTSRTVRPSTSIGHRSRAATSLRAPRPTHGNGSLASMRLQPGARVWASLKAAEVRAYPA